MVDDRASRWNARPWSVVLGAAAIRDLVQLGAVAANFALLVLVVRAFSLEGPAVHRLLALSFVGFLVHHLLPARLRMPWFLALSLGAIAMVFGTEQGTWNTSLSLLRTGWLVAIGIALVAICHLPLPLAGRIGLLLLAGAALAYLRVAHATTRGLTVVWPLIGSMFMFRLLIYLYDIQHERKRAPLTHSLSYFFLLPNVCFPLFPVVDYKTFVRSTVPDARRIAVYQTGLEWMLRGILQLIAYRFLARHVLLQPAEVVAGGDVVRFIVTNAFLYLRVSGHFHLVIGLLHLFGFDLPETNRRYFLASSFTDYWRRVNIYWKDFILKLFYYPAYFRVKHWGPRRALVAATVFSFAATWLLHSYQWFWLRGDFLFAWQDMVFWGVLAGLVVANSLWELSRGRERALRRRAWSLRRSAGLSLRTAGTFAVVSVLWSLWACSSLDEWLGLWRVADGTTLVHAAWVLAAIALAALVAEALPGQRATLGAPSAAAPPRATPLLPRGSFACASTALVLYALGTPAAQAWLDPRIVPFTEALAGRQLRDVAAAEADHGYYEALMNVGRFNPRLWEVYTHQPAAWGNVGTSNISRPTQDFRLAELVPSSSFTFNGMAIATNRWGMRDADYEQAKPAGTFRIAVLGSSHAMGLGVSASEVFEDRIERRLDRERPGGAELRYEVLNFAVSGYSPLAQLPVLDRVVPPFGPDLVLVVGHSVDRSWTTEHLVKALRLPGGMPYESLGRLARELGLGAGTHRLWARSRLKPHEPELLAWAYRQLVERSRGIGALPVYAFVALPYETASKAQTQETLAAARAAGFVVIDLSDIYRGLRAQDLALADWNLHPNARAHGLIADAIYHALTTDPRIDLGERSTRVVGSTRDGERVSTR